MLYTKENVLDFAAYMLAAHGKPVPPNINDLTAWETNNNFQPLQIGQTLTIETVDGLKISTEIVSMDYCKKA